LPETDEGSISATSPQMIVEAAEAHDVVLMGPGLGTHPQTVQAIKTVLPQLESKLVLDADALNAIASDDCTCIKEINRTKSLPVLTPHPGEMIRLMGDEYDGHELKEDGAHRGFVAVAFARRHRVVLALKGAKTVVTDGARVYINNTGNPGMAKAGMGDVLAGVIAALIGQGFSEFDATMLGVYLHGLAGDIVCATMGEFGILATDVIEALPAAFQRHQQAS
ncbi:MAG: NAD(P)H-hydrate dehydratase, partial [Planctomycetota bacterium]